MEKYHGNTVEYWKRNAEENYLTTPISVLKYITVLEEQAEQLQKPNVSISLPNYEYEMLIDDEGTPFEINSWIPITTDRIKDPSRIDEYIAKGLIRKATKEEIMAE